MGTAFQIADDLLDFVGDPKITGKQPGNDVSTGRVTLPLIYSLKKVGERSSQEIVDCLKNNNGAESFERVFEFVSENGGIDYAYRKASQLGQQGLEAIARVEDSVYMRSLSNLVEFATRRAS